jgi:hypothetical protein
VRRPQGEKQRRQGECAPRGAPISGKNRYFGRISSIGRVDKWLTVGDDVREVAVKSAPSRRFRPPSARRPPTAPPASRPRPRGPHADPRPHRPLARLLTGDVAILGVSTSLYFTTVRTDSATAL